MFLGAPTMVMISILYVDFIFIVMGNVLYIGETLLNFTRDNIRINE